MAARKLLAFRLTYLTGHKCILCGKKFHKNCDRSMSLVSALGLLPQLHKLNKCLVNNAGFVLGVDKVGTINPDDVEAMFKTNVLGLVDITQVLVNRKCCPLSEVSVG